MADFFILLVKSNLQIQSLRLPTRQELKALAIVDDSQIISITAVVSINACLWVIKIFCVILGMKINWDKTVAICSPCLCPRLLGDLQNVWMLQIGETHPYLGVEHEASGEDRCIGPQIVTKVCKRCQKLQSPFC